MKNVLGGVAAADECIMSVTYDNGQSGSDRYVIPGGPGTGSGSASYNANLQCVAWITSSTLGVATCKYDCLGDGIDPS